MLIFLNLRLIRPAKLTVTTISQQLQLFMVPENKNYVNIKLLTKIQFGVEYLQIHHLFDFLEEHLFWKRFCYFHAVPCKECLEWLHKTVTVSFRCACHSDTAVLTDIQ